MEEQETERSIVFADVEYSLPPSKKRTQPNRFAATAKKMRAAHVNKEKRTKRGGART